MKSLRSLALPRPFITKSPFAFAALCLAGLSVTSQSAILIDADGITLDFATAPAANGSEWSTITAGIAGTDVTWTSDAQVDAGVQALTEALISNPLGTSTTNPPSSNVAARHNTSLFLLQTKPTGAVTAGVALLARLSNATASTFTDLKVTYDYGFTTFGAETSIGHRVYFSLTGAANSWSLVPGLSGLSTSTVGLNSTFSTTGWAPGAPAYLLFIDDNNTPSDDTLTIDNVNFLPTLGASATNVVWNLAHSVGGAPGGNFEVSGAQYWLNGPTPTGYASADIANFSQNPVGTAVINVPSAITSAGVNVSNTSGTYEIGGPGAITAALTKTNNGTLRLTSANSFTTVTLGGGVTITQNNAAFGNAGITVGGPATLQTDVDLSAGALNGTGPLTKTGPGTLTVSGAGNGTGGVTVAGGKLRALTTGGLGAQNLIVEGTSLIFAHTIGTDQTMTPGAVVNVGAAGAELNVENGFTAANVGTGVIFGTTNSISGSGTITKTGPGALRLRSNNPGLSSPWIINGGMVEYGAFANAMGTGLVTINAGGELIGQNVAVPVAAIILNGGAIGTRSGANTNFSGTIQVTADSELRARSASTPGGSQPFTISGQVTGTGVLSVTGPLPGANGVIPNPIVDAATTRANSVRLTNTTNNFSNGIIVTARQVLSSEAAGGTGSALGSGPITLSSATLRVLDNGVADAGTLAYGNALIVNTAAAPNDIASTIEVNRQATGTFASNAVVFNSLNIAGGSVLNTIGGNGYRVEISGLTTVTGAGDITFAPDTAALALTGGISGGTHGIIKNGPGVLAIVGGSAHTGNTVINAGTFNTTGQLSGTPLIDIKTGATLDVTLAAGGLNLGGGQTIGGSGTVLGTVNLAGGAGLTSGAAGTGNLTINGNLNAGLSRLDITVTGGVPTSIIVNGDVTATGAASSADFFVASNNLTTGTYTLLDYTGVLTGFSGFGVGSLPPRVIANLVNNTANTSIDLNVTGADFPVWTGRASGAWTTAAVGGLQNWKLNGSNLATEFMTNDRVLFDDTAAGTTTIAINDADVTVAGLTFNNAAKDYTINGSFGIAGAVNLDKTGGAKLTLNNINSFTGALNINGGTVSAATLADGGLASSIGAGTVVNIDGGALEITGTGSTNRAINVALAGGTLRAAAGSTPTFTGVTTTAGELTIDSAGTMLITGNIAGTGGVTLTGAGTTTINGNILAPGVLTKSGAGTAILAGAGNVPSAVTISAGTLQVGDGTATGSVGAGLITNDGALVVLHNGAVELIVGNAITGTGSLTKNGNGQLRLNGPGNTDTGVMTVNGGTVVLSSASTINNVGGDLVVNAGATVRYSTDAAQIANHIADNATITVNGGTFGSAGTLADPTAGVTETVANISVLNGGTFLSGRNALVTPFTITGTLSLADGTVLVGRAGRVTANTVSITGTGTINLDGGGTADTIENASTLTVGAGGLTLTGTTINFNNGPSAVATGSEGSIINLGGNLTSTGNSVFVHQSPAVTQPRALVDLQGGVRNFNITGSLTVGVPGATVDVINGGITKSGPGTLFLSGNNINNTYSGPTEIEAGSIVVTGTLSASTPINVHAGATLDIAAVAGGFTLGQAQTLKGGGNIVGLLNIAGTISPGDVGTIDTLTASATVNFDVSGTSVAQFDISKTAGPVLSSDLLSAATLISYDGTLSVTHTGLTLAFGDTFNLFDAPSFQGGFDSFNLPALDPGLSWSTDNLTVNGTLSVIPEPGSVALLLGGLAMLASRRRREK